MGDDEVGEYRPLWFPVHLGAGRHLFGEGMVPRALRLTGIRGSEAGVVMTTYEPDGGVRLGSIA